VLIGYDGSEQAGAAVEAAGRLLQVRETLLETVWSSCQAVAGAGVAGMPVAVATKAAAELDRSVREAAQKTAEQGARLAEAHGLEVKTETLQADGNVWQALIDSVHTHEAGAVVVGSRGRSAFGAALMGSVSRALVHHVPAPVLVVRPAV
jgi:nucleotide-binding universal stress UspA family protein